MLFNIVSEGFRIYLFHTDQVTGIARTKQYLKWKKNGSAKASRGVPITDNRRFVQELVVLKRNNRLEHYRVGSAGQAEF